MSIPEPIVWVLCLAFAGLVLNYLRKTLQRPAAQKPGAASPALSANSAELFDLAPIGYLEIDKEGVIRRANRRITKLLGCDERALIGKHCAELVPKLEQDRFKQLLNGKLTGDSALTPYLRDFLRADGGKLAMEVHEQLLRDTSGRTAGMRIAVIDVSLQKESEQQAYQVATELRALFQAFPDLFLRVDRTGTVVDAKGGRNDEPLLAGGSLVNKELEAFLPAPVAAQVREAQERVRKSRSMEVIEFTIEQRSGPQSYEARLLPLDWEQWIAILRNITGRKEDEQRLKEYSQELERKNEELEAALVTAREATQMKSRFLANMSHEIRTPMNGVLGMTDFLMGTRLDVEQKEYAQSIQRSASSLLTLINDILDFSRIEAGKLRLDRVVFPLQTMLQEGAGLFALQARAKGLDFVCEIAPNLDISVAGDPDRLRQVLTNLLGNAIKFTESGRVSLTAESVQETSQSIRVLFSVRDTGIGVPRNQQQRIFESFTQADTSSTRKYGGTGLGLAISKQLVDLLGGEIGVESEPGRGSRFWFSVPLEKPAAAELASASVAAERPRIAIPTASSASAAAVAPEQKTQPLAATPPASDPPKQAAAAAAAVASAGGLPRRILLAEDNDINQRITLRLLEKMGLAADAVLNGSQAVEALRKKKYDLVLMDCQMPVMDGFEATAVIRHGEGADRHTPICALTANAMEGDRERCLASGMDDYISKPVSFEKLREAVNRWVNHAGA